MKTSAAKPPTKKTRVLVADDHPLFREGLVQLINHERDLSCCGEADTVASTETAVTALKPDLLVLDLRLKDGDGLQLIKTLRARFPKLLILVVSQHAETLYAERALRAGARGYVMKEEATEEVRIAIRTILKGELFVSRKMSVLALHKLLAAPGRTHTQCVERLTDRELQVFQMLGAGMGTTDIAAELHLSTKTVETHRENLKHKLGLRNAVDLLCHAVHWVHGGPEGDPRRSSHPLAP
ncbi:MAG TPA: response regulator transcription factor [Haliangiales bacterium]|nr:response regulator transcription factor [Haliangiales bacterium]